MLSDDHRRELERAVDRLENPAFTGRMMGRIGRPIEKGVESLPAPIAKGIGHVAHAAIANATRIAIASLDEQDESGRPRNHLHRAMAAASGGFGGLFGLPALAVELPVSTTLMLRSIADIARSQGEDLQAREARLACMEVFALGGRSKSDDAAESGYLAVRAGLAKAVSEAAEFLARNVVVHDGTPALSRLILAIAARFKIQVTQKFLAQATPVAGALGGAAINILFMDHFQQMATAHFTVRRLERTYGADPVQAEYRRILERMRGGPGAAEALEAEVVRFRAAG